MAVARTKHIYVFPMYDNQPQIKKIIIMYFFVPESSNDKDKIVQTPVLLAVYSSEENICIHLKRIKSKSVSEVLLRSQ